MYQSHHDSVCNEGDYMTPTHHKVNIPVHLHILTPVFVGSGQTLDPLRYTIQKDRNGEIFLHHFDLDRWVLDHAEDTAFSAALDSSNYREIRRIIQKDLSREHNDPTKGSILQYSLSRRAVLNQKLLSEFIEELSQSASENRLLIDAALTNPITGRLLIPGSSVKGAIRTAILNWLDENHRLKLKDQHRPMQRADEIFGGIPEHAFKALKIADFEIPSNQGVVFKAEEKKKNSDRSGTPKNSCEAAPSLISKQPQHCEIFSKIVLGFNQDSSGNLNVRYHSIQESFDWPRICKVTTDFYLEHFKDEIAAFYDKTHLQRTRSALQPIEAMIRDIDTETQMLLRVGHYSHFNCVTINDNKHQMRKGPNTTRTLADGNYPFGWVILSKATGEELMRYQQKLETEPSAPEHPSEISPSESPPEKETFSLDKLLAQIHQLSDWGQLAQFGKAALADLPKEHYSPKIAEALKTQFDQAKPSKKKLKRNPNLLKEREAELESWLERFQE